MMGRQRFNPRRAFSLWAALGMVVSCTENLPTGPDNFGVQLSIVVPHDTLVVGDSSVAQARATDGSGHQIQSLSFVWGSADSATLGLAFGSTADGTSGRQRIFVGRKTGRSSVSLTLSDQRFVTTPAVRNETVVLGGVRVLTAHDSTLTAINDTAVAVAAGLVHVNGALVPKGGQGVRWVHQGTHTAVVATGDTLRYVARSNGPDTLIATSDFCLAGAKCADTIVARVGQVLVLSLSTHTLRGWSFSDSLAPNITLADRRGSGLAGTTIRFLAATPADTSLVRITPPIGASDPTTGVMATPRLVTVKNGTARVTVQAIGTDGSTVVASDTITEIVRQVARVGNVEPLRAVLSAKDSIPVRAVARDARGAVIADATVSITSTSGLTFHDPWAGPNAAIGVATTGLFASTVTGMVLPDSNPLAPQVPVTLNISNISVLAADTVKAGTTQVVVPLSLLDSMARPANGAVVTFATSFGAVPPSLVLDANGQGNVIWVPPDSAASYTLTGVRPSTPAPASVADSAGLIVLRRSVEVIASDPSATKSTVEITAVSIAANGTATITVKVKDRFGNIVKTAAPTDFTVTITRGAAGAFTCASGVCTSTYTAPATAGADSISVKIGGVEILFSPLTLTIT